MFCLRSSLTDHHRFVADAVLGSEITAGILHTDSVFCLVLCSDFSFKLDLSAHVLEAHGGYASVETAVFSWDLAG